MGHPLHQHPFLPSVVCKLQAFLGFGVNIGRARTSRVIIIPVAEMGTQPRPFGKNVLVSPKELTVTLESELETTKDTRQRIYLDSLLTNE